MNKDELIKFFERKGYKLKGKSMVTEFKKYKFNKNSLEKFIKNDSNWIKVNSWYYKDISLNIETDKLIMTKSI